MCLGCGSGLIIKSGHGELVFWSCRVCGITYGYTGKGLKRWWPGVHSSVQEIPDGCLLVASSTRLYPSGYDDRDKAAPACCGASQTAW